MSSANPFYILTPSYIIFPFPLSSPLFREFSLSLSLCTYNIFAHALYEKKARSIKLALGEFARVHNLYSIVKFI